MAKDTNSDETADTRTKDEAANQPAAREKTKATESAGPFSFAQILKEELRCIEGKRHRLEGREGAPFAAEGRAARAGREEAGAPRQRNELADERRAQQDALDQDLSGLAFSGGGIRSATFNLGILQALADLGLLHRFDYLSTVSGGGYIGSWLSALIERENRAAKPGEPPGVMQVEKRLRTHRGLDEKHEDPAITFLRRYSNYLTPRVGLLTADTWAVIATYLRNLLLNLLVVIPGLAAVLLLPRLIIALSETLEKVAKGLNGVLAMGWTLGWTYLGASIALGVVATCMMGYSFASLTLDPKTRRAHDAGGAELGRGCRPFLQQSTILQLLVLPLVLSALLASQWLPWASGGGKGWLAWACWAGLSYTGSWAIAFIVAKCSPWRGDQSSGHWWRLIGWAFPSGFLCGLLLKGIATVVFAEAGKLGDTLGPAYALGPPLVILWFILLGALHTGFMGRQFFDSQREWLSRLGAWLMIAAGAWAMLFGVVVYGTVVVYGLKSFWQPAMVSGWVAATLSGLLAAGKAGEGGSSVKIRRLVAAVAPYIFIAGLILILAVAVDWGVGAIDEVAGGESSFQKFCVKKNRLVAEKSTYERWQESVEKTAKATIEPPGPFWRPLYEAHDGMMREGADHPIHTFFMLLGLLGAGGFLAWRIDVNEFSMHCFYRNRLVRGYLGASVPRRERMAGRQPFTGFYEGDDIELQATRSSADPGILAYQPGPLHLINTALNLVGGEELAWQERKAASFVLSPLFCGFDTLHEEEEPPAREDRKIGHYAYRRTDDFGHYPTPLTLGTAFAISGAAASPNMGFHSSAALSFLLTVFNVRLGWWLGNPRHRKTYVRSGPHFAMLHLFKELTGKTRARTRYVYLSDGGHFENLGIYELVRRRCRTIIACDAGADPELSFQDLGNAIRKCRSDFGVEIDLHVDEIRDPEGKGSSEWHCAVGTIYYPTEDGETEEGTLLYIKSSLTGDEPEDILEYQRQNPAFPHQSTGDQFFDESQFESYRRLGHHVATSALGAAVEAGTETIPGQRRKVFHPEKMWLALQQRWYPRSSSIEDSFTRHTRTLDTLIERLRRTDELSFLDSQIYPEWHRLLQEGEAPEGTSPEHTLWLPESAREKRHGFYFCNALIQLMENVYLDLELDREWEHPDNRGWLNLFKHWSWSGMFRVTWAISAATYGQRFQAFCSRHLGLEIGTVKIRSLPNQVEERVEAGEARAMAGRKGGRSLNFYEREQVGLYRRYCAPAVHTIQHLLLVVPGSSAIDAGGKELFRFAFGYALLDAEGRILLFRIQDHLRKMGLGRRALRHLLQGEAVDTNGDSELSSLFREQVCAIAAGHREMDSADAAARERFDKEFDGGEDLYLALLRSVRRELREEGS